MFSPLVWVSCPLHPELLPAQRNRPPKASISRKGHLVPSWPLPTDAHLLKPVTTHTFASAGAWPHAAPTIWTKRFKKKKSSVPSLHCSQNCGSSGENPGGGTEREEYRSLCDQAWKIWSRVWKEWHTIVVFGFPEEVQTAAWFVSPAWWITGGVIGPWNYLNKTPSAWTRIVLFFREKNSSSFDI